MLRLLSLLMMGEDEYVDPSAFEKNENGVYMVDGHDLALSLSDCATWDSTTGLSVTMQWKITSLHL